MSAPTTPSDELLPESEPPNGSDHTGSPSANGSEQRNGTEAEPGVNGEKEADAKPRGLKRVTRPIRKLFEFKGIGKTELAQYQHKVKNLYDGPQGAILALGSKLSLHEPLVGRMIRKKIFDITRFDSILDVGSGAGQILGHLVTAARQDTQIVGFDLSHQMLRRARTRVKSTRPAYIAANMMEMPFADNSFDCVTCGWVLEHLPDPVPGLKEMCRVLRPGGSLLLLVSEDTVLGSLVSRTWRCRTYNRDELESACNEAGLPWQERLWFTGLHRALKMGGIVVEARKPESSAIETSTEAASPV